MRRGQLQQALLPAPVVGCQRPPAEGQLVERMVRKAEGAAAPAGIHLAGGGIAPLDDGGVGREVLQSVLRRARAALTGTE